jgi:glucan phosphoethanolaminetransferase (alkaline phosphatase superfamily)
MEDWDFKMKQIFKGKSGQMTIIAIIMLFVSLIVYFIFRPLITSFSDSIIADVNQSTNEGKGEVLMLNSIPVLIVLGIIVALIWWIIPKTGQQGA